MKNRNPYLGKWRIIEMEMWDQEYIDMETEGHFLFGKDNLGSFHFGLVKGLIDYRLDKIGEFERVEFSWEGQDENDDALGRGWAILENDHLQGRFYFHLGDDSWFKAKKYK